MAKIVVVAKDMQDAMNQLENKHPEVIIESRKVLDFAEEKPTDVDILWDLQDRGQVLIIIEPDAPEKSTGLVLHEETEVLVIAAHNKPEVTVIALDYQFAYDGMQQANQQHVLDCLCIAKWQDLQTDSDVHENGELVLTVITGETCGHDALLNGLKMATDYDKHTVDLVTKFIFNLLAPAN